MFVCREEEREYRYLMFVGVKVSVPCCHTKAKPQLSGWPAGSQQISGMLSAGGERFPPRSIQVAFKLHFAVFDFLLTVRDETG